MRIETIEILGLFGIFDHRIVLGPGSRVTIVYGPNGVGKTTILRLLDDFFAARFERISRTPFAELAISLDNGLRILVRKATQSLVEGEPIVRDALADLHIQVTAPDGSSTNFLIAGESRKPNTFSFPVSMLEDELPVRRLRANLWEDLRTGERLSLAELAQNFSSVFPPLREIAGPRIPDGLEDILESVSVSFIETQRLVSVEATGKSHRHPRHQTASTAVQYSDDLVRFIQRNLATSAQLGQGLDRSFPYRLLEEDTVEVSEEKIRERYRIQSDRRNRLVEAALLDMGEELPFPDKELDAIERRILWAYLNDVDKKLAVFDGLLKRIELFKDIINSRFRFKSVFIDNESGFRFVTDQDAVLSPGELSSGEQHELVLTYQLLFGVQTGSLVLIDEPEISLHVSWQQKFLDDIERIAEVSDLYFLTATHSPQIINDRFDLAVSLRGPDDS